MTFGKYWRGEKATFIHRNFQKFTKQQTTCWNKLKDYFLFFFYQKKSPQVLFLGKKKKSWVCLSPIKSFSFVKLCLLPPACFGREEKEDEGVEENGEKEEEEKKRRKGRSLMRRKRKGRSTRRIRICWNNLTPI